jgi:hypothetical protein
LDKVPAHKLIPLSPRTDGKWIVIPDPKVDLCWLLRSSAQICEVKQQLN